MKWNTNLYDESHNFVSKYGEGILSYLKPQNGEHILDLGCGTGDLTYKIHQSGAVVIGIDASEDMIKTAKMKYPQIDFKKMNILDLQFNKQFDVIFSNAVLHWVPEKEKAIEKMYSNLKKRGRIVVEFGGQGCVEQLIAALRNCFTVRGYYDNANIKVWYYPSIGKYATELEKQNFRVVFAEHFDRPTKLKGKDGLKNWYLMFCDNYFVGISENEKESILDEIQSKLKSDFFINGSWYADYKRIRFVAIKE